MCLCFSVFVFCKPLKFGTCLLPQQKLNTLESIKKLCQTANNGYFCTIVIIRYYAFPPLLYIFHVISIMYFIYNTGIKFTF